MSVDRELLARYLAQASDLGGDVFLESVTAREARRLVAAAARGQVAEVTYDTVGVAASASPAMTREQARAALSAMFTADAPAAAPRRTAEPHASPANEEQDSSSNGALRVLADAAAGCTRCRLSEGRTQVVFGEGAAHADVVVVGEAPGQEEDRTGRPFVGRAGRLLDLLLLSAGYPRERVYICNVLKCRPPNNRNPLPDEVTTCTTSWLFGQLEAIAPKVLIAVGKFAAQTLCASDASVGGLRGRIHDYRGTPLIATYHPAYLLRSPAMVRTAWQDFQLLRKVHDEQA
jgi:uracil-DNA glycosylase